MTPEEILKKVRKIDIKTRQLTQQLFAGAYHSAYKGQGMSFSEVRAYQYGDDVRNIDWNVTARSNETHIKVFEEERELIVVVLLDVSASSYFGLTKQWKIESMIELAAMIASAATNQHDKIGAILYSDKVEKYIPPRKGRQHMLRAVTDMVMHEPQSKGSNLANALEYFYRVEKKRSVVFIISDFMADGYQSALDIVANKHDVTGIKVYDTIEQNLPAVGILQMQDIESGQTIWIDTDDAASRNAYKAQFDAYEKLYLSAFKHANAGHIEIQTTDDAFRILQKYFDSKSKRK